MPLGQTDCNIRLALLLLSTATAHQLALRHLDAAIPEAAAATLLHARRLRSLAAASPGDRHCRAALQVAGDALWSAWRATEHLEGHADDRLANARDDLERAARLVLCGLTGDERAAGIGMTARAAAARQD
ncbi:conserved protein of unknown function [Rhodovastum atsumiense]|uniref:Uncharacterized protein n=1 Tax=Rhodovastum atsumiense TaxID=504468 RepID=A0A5M6ISM3_9PROT|nr:hypothetical protein [Rhodovastum atsumiense]KAA5611320.1 hypothetical protein F1189_15345 [Rhodovastum atsumiense]CAH2601795.1 conserved protein of unknown function [Rhodovastum atsumiense]